MTCTLANAAGRGGAGDTLIDLSVAIVVVTVAYFRRRGGGIAGIGWPSTDAEGSTGLGTLPDPTTSGFTVKILVCSAIAVIVASVTGFIGWLPSDAAVNKRAIQAASLACTLARTGSALGEDDGDVFVSRTVAIIVETVADFCRWGPFSAGVDGQAALAPDHSLS